MVFTENLVGMITMGVLFLVAIAVIFILAAYIVTLKKHQPKPGKQPPVKTKFMKNMIITNTINTCLCRLRDVCILYKNRLASQAER